MEFVRSKLSIFLLMYPGSLCGRDLTPRGRAGGWRAGGGRAVVVVEAAGLGGRVSDSVVWVRDARMKSQLATAARPAHHLCRRGGPA